MSNEEDLRENRNYNEAYTYNQNEKHKYMIHREERRLGEFTRYER